MASAWRAAASKGVHELRFALCQTSEASQGVRCVWATHLAEAVALLSAGTSLGTLPAYKLSAPHSR